MSSIPNNPSHVETYSVGGRPGDRVRWGPIIAGLFVALSALTLLGLLGAAIGLSISDTGDNTRAYGWGAALWSIVIFLVSFWLGGWTAAKTAAFREEGSGLLHGAMVWAVAIPFVLYSVAGGIYGMAGASRMGTGFDVSTAMSRDVGDRAQTAGAQIRPDAYNYNTTSSNSSSSGNSSAGRMSDAHRAARNAAWGTLAALVFGLAAASFGGMAANRTGLTHRHGRGLLDREAER